jgi:Mrp family chromosome partitioning ATPase
VHARVEVNREALAHSGFALPDSGPTGLAEEMRLIKRRLLAAVEVDAEQGSDRARSILIASGKPGEGKTFVAISLALSIAAEQDRSVLLVDGDTSKPDLPTRLGLDDRAGLVDALADRRLDPDSLVVDTDIPRLSILTAGRKERNVPELMAAARTVDVFDRLLAADPRRIILIDSPPVLAASPAALLASHAGQGLVVVRADATSEADLKETVDLLSGCPRLSLVLNSTAFSLGGRRFGQYEEYR